MKIELFDIEKPVEQIRQHQTTRYWFDVDGQHYCITHQNGSFNMLDSDGCLLLEASCKGWPFPTTGNDSDRALFHELIMAREQYISASLAN